MLIAGPLRVGVHSAQESARPLPGPWKEAPQAVTPLIPIGGPLDPDQAALGRLSAASEAAIPDDWYAQMTRQIASSEYHINWQEDAGAYQSPNRRQDLRVTYRTDGFSLTPRVADSLWTVSLNVGRIGRAGHWMLPTDSAVITVEENLLVADHSRFAIDYRNSAEGMRQNFTVREKPAGDGLLEVRLRYTGTLHAADKGGNAIAFCQPVAGTSSHVPVLWYKDLHVWDAQGDTLEATASLEDDEIVLAVRDDGAQYPITVDPLSTTAAWTAESDQASASFGTSVSSAGDVNGDGYSDIIVGATRFDNGQSNEGRAFVFHGSATGPAAAPNWTFESDFANAELGIAVATAGDVNGDGFSDVAIGANGYTNGHTNEGRIYVFRGSATGLPATPNWTFESDVALARLGTSVACAGDVNGDGYSDVIAGAFDLSNGQTNEGRAYVFHGSAANLPAAPSWTFESNQASARLGRSVAGAGDVNGDGFSDVIIGVYNWDNGKGRALVFHGAGVGLPAAPNWSEEIDLPNAWFGYSVATAGDVNGDGYSDAIIGAWQYYGGLVGEGAAFVYHGSPTGLAAAPAWWREGDQFTAHFGEAVACAGDINGDGFADILVGAPDFDQTLSGTGRAQLWLGSSTGVQSVPHWTSDGTQAAEGLGSSAASAGDVNGDGYSDIIVGAPGYNGGQAGEGRAALYLGAAEGLTANAAWTAESDQAGGLFGCVASAGDVNGDGYSDVIVGASQFDNGQDAEGRAFIHHGGPAGLSPTPAWTAESDQVVALFGISVASAGDVNGDGYSDVIVGADQYDNGQLYEGRAFVYHGSPAGLSPTPAWTAESDQDGARFGWSVASAGDVNGDGYSDVIVGAVYYDNGQPDEGRAFVYHGSPAGLSPTPAWTAESDQAYAWFGRSVASAGDVNGDGYSDVIVGADQYNNGQPDEGRAFVYHGSPAGLSPTPAWTAESDQASAFFGWSVASAGDVNGDGYSDVIVGAGYYDNGQLYEGRAFVYHGSPAGLSPTPAWTAESDQVDARFGYSVASAGDVNGDGYSDVIVGALLFDNGQLYEGRAFVYHGSPAGLSPTPAWTAESDQVDARFGASVASAGDVNGDGYSDVIVGALLFDNGQTNEGRAFVYHGNNGTGRRHNLRLYNTNLTAPISASNIPVTQFGAGLYAKPFLGRGRVRMVWETRIQGQAFSSAGGRITNSTAFTAQQAADSLTFTSGVELKDLVDKLTSTHPITATKVRARLRYNMVTALTGQVFGPWRYMPGYLDGHGTHNNIPLPVEMLWMEAACEASTPTLSWATATERNSSHFIIERSTDGLAWSEAGRLPAAGHSQQVIEYTWRDAAPSSFATVYYRLRQVDLDGQEEVLAVLPMEACGGTDLELVVLPNPTDGPVELRWPPQDEAAGISELRVLDAHGRVLRSERVNAQALWTTMDLSGLAAGVYSIIGISPVGAQVSSVRVVRR
ncbi:MAG: FG-GAP-like repeat-containing protein [Flavobacteriales bacterium]|nr:MAG: FG-GAP-like repeat-containing protein [Flavobacteriales bacterium]